MMFTSIFDILVLETFLFIVIILNTIGKSESINCIFVKSFLYNKSLNKIYLHRR